MRPPPELVGRDREREVLDRLLADVRGGRSRALVLRGEAGIGKTALLQHAVRRATGFRVHELAGIEAEMELPFAGLHQLCAPMLDRLDQLAGPQREALTAAFGLSSGGTPDRFLVALAVLHLLSAAAEERPLLCAIDDGQWLDAASVQVLAFVARRVVAESVAIVVATRDTPGRRPFDGVPELPVRGLDEAAGRALLTSVVSTPLDERVLATALAEARGNPLALLELPRRMSVAGLAGGVALDASGDVQADIEGHYLARVRELPEASQRLLLTAAADPAGDAMLVWRAAQVLGIASTALAPAEDAGLVEVAVRVRFHHPLVRSAIYRAATTGERRAVHAALAEACDPALDADRRTWHRALGTAGSDEDVATELELSAARAATRGGLAAAAALLERSAELTDDAGERARRALAAAQAKHETGEPVAALALLAAARAGPPDPLRRARADLLAGQLDFAMNRGRQAPALLVGAAKQLEALDVPLARDTYLEALTAAQFAGRFGGDAAVEVARAARAAAPARPSRPHDVLLDGVALMITDGHAGAAPLLRRGLEAFTSGDPDALGGFRWLWLAQYTAQELWDHDAWQDLAVLQLELVRRAGALSVLPMALAAVIVARIYAGELTAAASLLDDQHTATQATGSRLAPYGALIEAAWRGDLPELTSLVDGTLDDIVERGEGIYVSTCDWVAALLHNGQGRHDRALVAARAALDPVRALDWPRTMALAELVEAAIRCGEADAARDALDELQALTAPSGTDWGLGVEARSRALVSPAAVAEPLYREAVERLAATRVRGEEARAHLLLGEWLRAEQRVSDAREPLGTAHRMFLDMGMNAFADRAARELTATGVSVRERLAPTEDDLTPQERQVARLARDGLSNPEIGAELFLSPRTVEWHLRKVFAKLGIRSRRELSRAIDPA